MPDLNDAIALLKTGDTAGAQAMMRQIVGLPPLAPGQTEAPVIPNPAPPSADPRARVATPGAPNMFGPTAAAAPGAGPTRPGGMPMQGGAPTPSQLRAAADAARMRKRQPTRPFAKGGSVGSASKRADGCAQRGKTKGKML